MADKNFIKNVEHLINPVAVGSLHFIQQINAMLPKKVQNALVTSSSKKIPFMGFVVEPYSLFLCYEIADADWAAKLLPDNFKLIKTKIFKDDDPKYYGILSCFTAHTSAFWGSRVEFYIIAEDQKSGLLSWIIVDYDSNTISYDTQSGLRAPNCSGAVLTTDYNGNLFADFKRDDGSRELVLSANVTDGGMVGLDQRLWLEGNLSVGYGRVLSQNNADIFSLRFEPEEVKRALKIPSDSLNLKSNTWFLGLLAKEPSEVVCFPFAQHFVSDSPGRASNIATKAELEKSIKEINFDSVQVFSARPFVKMLMVGSGVSSVIIIVLLVLIILRMV